MNSGIRPCLQHPKKSFGGLNIASDLFAQQLRRIEASFITNSLQKLKAYSRDRRRDCRVEHERLDRLRIPIKGRPSADVCDGVDEGPAVHCRLCDVNPRARNQLIVGLEIERRNGDIAPTTCTRRNASLDFEPAAQQAAGSGNAPLLNTLSHMRAADHDATRHDGCNLDQLKFVPALKHLHRSRLAMSEDEVTPHAEHSCVQSVDQISPDEGIGCERRKVRVEACDEHQFDPRALDKAKLLIDRVDQPRRLVRREQAHGMRVECEDGRSYPQLAGTLNNGAENALVSKMEAIEVADREDAGTVLCGIGQLGNHFHRVMIIRNDWGKVRKARSNHGYTAGSGRLSLG